MIHVALENAGPMTICALTKHQDQLMHVGPLTLDWSVIVLFPSLQRDNLKLSRFTLRLGNAIALDNLLIILSLYINIYFLRFLSLHRIPEKQTGSQTVFYLIFISICKLPTLLLTFHQTEISWLFFRLFRFALYHFIIFKSWILSYEFMLSKGKNFEVMCVTYNHGDRYLFCVIFLPLNMHISFIPRISLGTKMMPLISPQMFAFLDIPFIIILTIKIF